MRIISRLILLLLLIGTKSAYSEPVPEQHLDTEKLYQIEIIVFKHITPEALSSEQWPVDTLQSTNNQAINLVSENSDVGTEDAPDSEPGTKVPAYKLLPSSYFELSDEALRLKNSSDYSVISHIAWLQPISSTQPLPVHLSTDQLAESSDPATLETSDENIDNDWQLDGTISLAMKRYITTSINIDVSIPKDELTQYESSNMNSSLLASQSTVNFRIIQSRRMKSGELNYFDHPLFGILMKVKPYVTSSSENSA